MLKRYYTFYLLENYKKLKHTSLLLKVCSALQIICYFLTIIVPFRIQNIVESGILKFMTREGLPDTQICPLDLGSTERQLKNADLFMTYVIVAGGFIISCIVFAAELFVVWYKNRKNVSTPRFTGGSSGIKVSNKFSNGLSHGMSLTHRKKNNSEENTSTFRLPPPPPYHSLFYPPFAFNNNGKKKSINGRDYWVVESMGQIRLIPVRTPSALLFQYTN